MLCVQGIPSNGFIRHNIEHTHEIIDNISFNKVLNTERKDAVIMLSEYGAVMTIDEVCETLMIGRNASYKLLNSGALRAFRIGRVWKIPRESVEAFIHLSLSVSQ